MQNLKGGAALLSKASQEVVPRAIAGKAAKVGTRRAVLEGLRVSGVQPKTTVGVVESLLETKRRQRNPSWSIMCKAWKGRGGLT